MMFLILSTFWLQSQNKILLSEWDLTTITAGDYSVEMDITEDMYNRWEADHYFNDKEEGKSAGESLKESIIKYIETVLTEDF